MIGETDGKYRREFSNTETAQNEKEKVKGCNGHKDKERKNWKGGDEVEGIGRERRGDAGTEVGKGNRLMAKSIQTKRVIGGEVIG